MENKTIQKEEDLWEQFIAFKEKIKLEVMVCDLEKQNEN